MGNAQQPTTPATTPVTTPVTTQEQAKTPVVTVVKETLVSGAVQAGKTVYNTIIAVAVLIGLVFGGGFLIKSCGGIDVNETGTHEYINGESKTDYKPSPALDAFITEMDSILATYRAWLKQRDAGNQEAGTKAKASAKD